MKRIYFKLSEKSLESQTKAERRTPFLEITFKDSLGVHTHTICAGVHDLIFGFRENGVTFVVAYNPSRAFIGLETFEGRVPRGSVFFRGSAFGELEANTHGSIPAMLDYLLGYIPGFAPEEMEVKAQ